VIRDVLIDGALKLHLEEPLLRIRSTVSPRYRGQTQERRQLRQLLASVLTSSSNCIDIGAYRGRVLSELARLAPSGHHIAYEPLPNMYQLLVRRFPSVEVRQAAVSNYTGTTTFTYVHDSPGLSGFRNRWSDSEHHTEELTVRTETLDDDLPDGYAPTFIKVDVEGAERFVFEGAIRTIATYRPVILFEHGKGGADHYPSSSAEVHFLLTSEGGLRIFDLDGNGPYSAEQFEDAFHRNERWDFLARP
jgi:FkbM family methyltransferase